MSASAARLTRRRRRAILVAASCAWERRIGKAEGPGIGPKPIFSQCHEHRSQPWGAGNNGTTNRLWPGHGFKHRMGGSAAGALRAGLHQAGKDCDGHSALVRVLDAAGADQYSGVARQGRRVDDQNGMAPRVSLVRRAPAGQAGARRGIVPARRVRLAEEGDAGRNAVRAELTLQAGLGRPGAVRQPAMTDDGQR